MQRHKTLMLGSIALVGLVAVTGIVLAQSRTNRADCPGKIVCPKTGELTCRDKCPTVDPNRPDWLGRLVCPLTGELVCKDRCPLHANEVTPDTPQPKVPPCCAREG